MKLLAWIYLAIVVVATVASRATAASDVLDQKIQDGEPEVIVVDNIQRKMTIVQPRIIGGTPAGLTEFPFYTLFQSSDSFCGGSLIHGDIVLTAGHCNSTIQDSTVSVGAYKLDGDTQGYEENITAAVTHPKYDRATITNDVRILKLANPVPIVAIPLNSDPNVPVVGQQLTLTGLGYTAENGTASDILLKVNINYVAPATCNNEYPGFYNGTTQLCAGVPQGGKDSCFGDSGGPLFTSSTVQVGIVSFATGCGLPDFPTVYARVSYYLPFIRQQVCALSSYPPPYCFSTPQTPLKVRLDIHYDLNPSSTSYRVFNSYKSVLREAAGTAADSNKLVSRSVSLIPGYYYWKLVAKTGFCCTKGNGFYASYAVLKSGLYQQIIPPQYADFDGPSFKYNMPVPNAGANVNVPTGTLRVEVQYDDSPKETAVTIFDSTNKVVGSSGLGTAANANKLVAYTFQLKAGSSYKVQFTDSFGDGFCCGNGLGYYAIYLANKNGVNFQAIVPPTYPNFTKTLNVQVNIPSRQRRLFSLRETTTNTTAQTLPPPPVSMLANVCRDSTSMFSYSDDGTVDGVVLAADDDGIQTTCQRLASEPAWRKELLCKPHQKAYRMCPKTCGKCVVADDGQDSTTAEFIINNTTRTCAWLSDHSFLWPSECIAGNPAYTYCKGVCNSRDS